MKVIIQAICIFTLFAVARTAASQDNVKSYHGAICTSKYENENIELARSLIGTTVVENVEKEVCCPLIRDEQWSSSQIHNAYVELFNDTAYGPETVTCTLATQDEDNGGSWVDFHELSTTAAGFQQLGPFYADTYYGNEGSYSMYCELGIYDTIYHIYVREYE